MLCTGHVTLLLIAPYDSLRAEQQEKSGVCWLNAEVRLLSAKAGKQTSLLVLDSKKFAGFAKLS